MDDDGGADYEKIQDAIDASEDGDTVRMWEGTYEENVVVDKSIDFIENGSETTTIDGGESGDVVQMTADWVNMSGFDISNSDNHGIYLKGSNYCTITNNNCENNEYGISLFSSSDCKITNNTCAKNNECGIGLFFSSNCKITNNTCANSFYGIFLSSSSNCTIENNTCSANDLYGILFEESSDCKISNNNCSNNHNGIYLISSSGGTISNNICTSNERGVCLWKSSGGIITSNICTSSNRGIWLGDSSDCKITNNTILENSVGIYLKISSGENTAHYNNIYNNTEYGIDASRNDGYTISATNNYWGAASGPYHPTKNPKGEGDIITDYVDFRPWLNENGTVNQSPSSNPGDNGNTSSTDTLRLLLLGISILLLGNAAILTYAAHTSEALRYRILRFFLPLYSRINEKHVEKDIRQQNIRGRIYQCIKLIPGINFTGMKKEVAIGTGTLVYHLSVLGREGYIRSAVSGNRKVFWVKAEFPGVESAALSDIQKRIVELLEKNGRMSRGEILEKIEISMSTLHTHIKRLVEKEKIVEEKEGNRFFYRSHG